MTTDPKTLAERLLQYDRDERRGNFAEACYWINQWRRLAKDQAEALEALSVQPEAEAARDLSNIANELDDIEVNEDGLCKWTDVANAQTHIRAKLRRSTPPAAQPMPRGGVEPDWQAESLKLYRQNKKLRKSLQEHHDWHLKQGDQEIEGITINGAADYSDSGMCDRTIAALDEVLPSGIAGYEKWKESAAQPQEGDQTTGEPCICQTDCDCQQPEEVGGVALISDRCPIHNTVPDPDPDCPIHCAGSSTPQQPEAGAVAWRIRFKDGFVSRWFDSKPPTTIFDDGRTHEFAYASPTLVSVTKSTPEK